ncbi:MAG: radical SAM protein [Deltaproteobacteria bacterium]|nr:radical SAM protein [Deltaproteobacteria bacterium]
MRMLLLNPAQMINGRPLKVKKAFVIPYPVYMIAGQTPSEWTIDVANDYTDDINYDGDYDLVGITLSTIHSVRGYQIAEEFRKRGKTVVMGGFHATLFTDEALQYADAVVAGEAEYVWPQLLEDFKAGRLKKLYKAEKLPRPQDLAPPRYDLINRKRYMVDVMPAETSRGCPFACNYCSVTEFYGQKYRVRPPRDVVRDVRSTKTRFISFVDDNVAANKAKAAELFEELIPGKDFLDESGHDSPGGRRETPRALGAFRIPLRDRGFGNAGPHQPGGRAQDAGQSGGGVCGPREGVPAVQHHGLRQLDVRL